MIQLSDMNSYINNEMTGEEVIAFLTAMGLIGNTEKAELNLEMTVLSKEWYMDLLLGMRLYKYIMSADMINVQDISHPSLNIDYTDEIWAGITPNNLFQHPLAICIGILIGTYMPDVPFYDPDDRDGGGGDTYTDQTPDPPYPPDEPKNGPPTGRGGWYYDCKGDRGKVTNTMKAAGEWFLGGSGASRHSKGYGFKDGSFGQGGGYDGGAYTSGGGGGIYGGGSGFVEGGGGGGSSGVTASMVNLWPDEYDIEHQPYMLQLVTHYGVDNTVALKDGYTNKDMLQRLEGLITLNSPFLTYHMHEHLYMSYYADWNRYLEMFTRANGNGFILIGAKDRHIEWTHYRFLNIEFDFLLWQKGKIKNIAKEIYYDEGQIQSFELEPGTYEMILYGACGGGTGTWLPWDDSFCGGFGGCELITVIVRPDLVDPTKKLKLYAYLGERGTRTVGYRAFGGGGACGNLNTGGGGATSIRYEGLPGDTDLDSLKRRIAVAGGGGGIYATVGDDDPNDKERNPWRGPLIGKGKLCTLYYPVNDMTRVIVEFDVVVSDNLSSPIDMNIRANLADGKEGYVEGNVSISESGHVKIEYDLDEIYEANTQTHEVTIDVSYEILEFNEDISSNPPLFISSPVSVSVSLNSRTGEAVYKTPLYINCSDKIQLDDSMWSDETLYLNRETGGSDSIELTDACEITLRSIEEPDAEVGDSINLVEGLVTELKSIEKYSIEASDSIELTDSLWIELKNIGKLSIEASDSIELTDSLWTDCYTLYNISASFAQGSQPGAISGAGVYRAGEQAVLTVSYDGDLDVEWRLNGSVISTDDSIVITVTGDAEYEVMLTGGIVLPFVTDGCDARFDGILNSVNGHVFYPVWERVGRNRPLVEIDNRGFESNKDARFDGIDNTIDGHKSSAIWEDVDRIRPIVSTDSLGFADDAVTDRFCAIKNTPTGHDAGTLDWSNVAE